MPYFTDVFKGNFDGAGHKVSGMTIGSADTPSQDYQYAGLFGYVTEETIKNVGVSGNIYISSTSDSYAGGLVGYANGSGLNVPVTITNCYSTATVSGTTYVGSFVAVLNMLLYYLITLFVSLIYYAVSVQQAG